MQDLQSYITFFESKLSSFSFDELTSKDAYILQSSLNDFKKLLDDALKKKKLSGINNSRETQLTAPIPKIESSNSIAKNTEKEAAENALPLARIGQQFMIPSRGIINAIEILEATDLDNSQKSLVHAIKFSSQLMLDASMDILEYSGLGEAEARAVVEFKFYSIIRDVVFLCNTLITNNDVRIETDIDPNIPTQLMGEPEKLSHILMNLLGNAIKNTQKGTILLKICLKEEYLDNLMLEFDVCNTGNGIMDEDIKSVFDPYCNSNSRAEEDNRPNFTLRIVKRLVQSLGGNIYASSRVGVGTVFTLTMPVKRCNKPEVTISQISTKSIQNLKILVFEHNDLNKKIIDVKLRIWKCKSFITDNVEDGIKMLQQNDIDIVLMDTMMPKMNGYKITNVIRNHNNKAISTVPIIAVTPDNMCLSKEVYSSKGMNDYLTKPFNSEELFQKLIQYKNQYK